MAPGARKRWVAAITAQAITRRFFFLTLYSSPRLGSNFLGAGLGMNLVVQARRRMPGLTILPSPASGGACVQKNPLAYVFRSDLSGGAQRG